MNDFVTLMGEQVQDGCVTEEGFLAYYAAANAVLPVEKENYFIDMVIKTWGLEVSASGASVAGPRLAEIEDNIFEKILDRCFSIKNEH